MSQQLLTLCPFRLRTIKVNTQICKMGYVEIPTKSSWRASFIYFYFILNKRNLLIYLSYSNTGALTNAKRTGHL